MKTSPEVKKQLSPRDFNSIAEYICDEWHRRKQKRKEDGRDEAWSEVDRQVRMQPEIKQKLNADGTPNKDSAWLPEIELPLQAQTLEVLTADARRMMFPDTGAWFSAHANMTDEYLEKADYQSYISGDQNEVPSQITQDNADKLVISTVRHFEKQYDFEGSLDKINADAFKYGFGVGRCRVVNKDILIPTARGVVKKSKKFPVLVPQSAKSTFLDDRQFAVMNEGFSIGPLEIFEKDMSLDDMSIAARKGSTDPENMNGGWIPKNLRGVHPGKSGCVKVLEAEGDLIVPRSGQSIVIPGAICTVIKGQKSEKDDTQVTKLIRLRLRSKPYSSYLIFPYHYENVDCPYPSSPLIKGWPVQAAATQALSRLMEVSALNASPPIGYNRDDMVFAQNGGPLVSPGAQWGSVDAINVFQIGDPSSMLNIYIGLLQQYADVTGVNAPRLGAQTVSHTTAFAKEAEISRGTIRTVDYVRSTLKGPMTQWLYMAYDQGRDVIGEEDVLYDREGFISITKDRLPEMVEFEAHGSGGPAEDQAKVQARMQSLQMALQMDQLNVQLGNQPTVDIESAIKQTLREGKWTDIDAIVRTEQLSMGTQPESALAGGDEAINAAPGAALQALALASQ